MGYASELRTCQKGKDNTIGTTSGNENKKKNRRQKLKMNQMRKLIAMPGLIGGSESKNRRSKKKNGIEMMGKDLVGEPKFPIGN